MKEYISQKFEPSEDDRELSRVISKAISPRKGSSQTSSFGAATNMAPASNSADNKAPLVANTNESEFLFYSSTINNLTHLQLYSDAFDSAAVVEAENHGKILQPN